MEVFHIILRDLENLLRADAGFMAQYPEFEISPYGSTVNGLLEKGSSDLDCCILIKGDQELKVRHQDLLQEVYRVVRAADTPLKT